MSTLTTNVTAHGEGDTRLARRIRSLKAAAAQTTAHQESGSITHQSDRQEGRERPPLVKRETKFVKASTVYNVNQLVRKADRRRMFPRHYNDNEREDSTMVEVFVKFTEATIQSTHRVRKGEKEYREARTKLIKFVREHTPKYKLRKERGDRDYGGLVNIDPNLRTIDKVQKGTIHRVNNLLEADKLRTMANELAIPLLKKDGGTTVIRSENEKYNRSHQQMMKPKPTVTRKAAVSAQETLEYKRNRKFRNNFYEDNQYDDNYSDDSYDEDRPRGRQLNGSHGEYTEWHGVDSPTDSYDLGDECYICSETSSTRVRLTCCRGTWMCIRCAYRLNTDGEIQCPLCRAQNNGVRNSVPARPSIHEERHNLPQFGHYNSLVPPIIITSTGIPGFPIVATIPISLAPRERYSRLLYQYIRFTHFHGNNDDVFEYHYGNIEDHDRGRYDDASMWLSFPILIRSFATSMTGLDPTIHMSDSVDYVRRHRSSRILEGQGLLTACFQVDPLNGGFMKCISSIYYYPRHLTMRRLDEVTALPTINVAPHAVVREIEVMTLESVSTVNTPTTSSSTRLTWRCMNCHSSYSRNAIENSGCRCGSSTYECERCGMPASRTVVRRGRHTCLPIPDPNPQVASELNGNNGEATNGDDLDTEHREKLPRPVAITSSCPICETRYNRKPGHHCWVLHTKEPQHETCVMCVSLYANKYWFDNPDDYPYAPCLFTNCTQRIKLQKAVFEQAISEAEKFGIKRFPSDIVTRGEVNASICAFMSANGTQIPLPEPPVREGASDLGGADAKVELVKQVGTFDNLEMKVEDESFVSTSTIRRMVDDLLATGSQTSSPAQWQGQDTTQPMERDSPTISDVSGLSDEEKSDSATSVPTPPPNVIDISRRPVYKFLPRSIPSDIVPTDVVATTDGPRRRKRLDRLVTAAKRALGSVENHGYGGTFREPLVPPVNHTYLYDSDGEEEIPKNRALYETLSVKMYTKVNKPDLFWLTMAWLSISIMFILSAVLNLVEARRAFVAILFLSSLTGLIYVLTFRYWCSKSTFWEYDRNVVPTYTLPKYFIYGNDDHHFNIIHLLKRTNVNKLYPSNYTGTVQVDVYPRVISKLWNKRGSMNPATPGALRYIMSETLALTPAGVFQTQVATTLVVYQMLVVQAEVFAAHQVAAEGLPPLRF